MIILDTNVVSEMMRATPEPAVVAWVTGSAIATRKVRHFIECGVEIINPFET